MKYLNKKLLSLGTIIIFSVLFVIFINYSNITNISIKDFFTSKALPLLEENIKNNIPGRKWIIKVKNKYEKLIMKIENNNVYFGKDNFLIKRYQETLNIKNTYEKLNAFYDKINYVNINLILVPSSTTIYDKNLPLFAYNDSELLTIKKVYEKVLFNKINVSNTLKDNSNKYQIYYKTDTNWTVYGAYYAYYEYAKQNNITPLELSNFDIETVSTVFKGNLYDSVEYTRYIDMMHMFYLNNSSYTVDEDGNLYDINKLNNNYMYEYYLGKNTSLKTIINNTNTTNKELVLIGDSLSNSIVPFLINHYKKIYLINPSLYNDKISNFILSNPNINDCVVLFNINNLTNDDINNIN